MSSGRAYLRAVEAYDEALGELDALRTHIAARYDIRRVPRPEAKRFKDAVKKCEKRQKDVRRKMRAVEYPRIPLEAGHGLYGFGLAEAEATERIEEANRAAPVWNPVGDFLVIP
jgi:hypothetical protein